eukprot:CAMPEP_0201713148 /NCGR_PEP_ID=MMETSP0593-20130828/60_1 /ASSEMBLY_ACC=CAM_ASM_000672 /TAXON_ID=267983 /ORGANISM="Skeletonema japonicum, Strain CCMP2506" /LENGTH=706 /DNA_ID=CAMNT_0048202239 /DNA_START=76 /DNA_END=2196 /DNA_ORIENTATION=-
MSYLHNHRHNVDVGGFEEAGSLGDEETLTPQEAYEIERRMTSSSSELEQGYRSQPQPHVSRPDESSSTAIFWTRPKKIIAAISSIALVVGAAAVGVSLSNNKSSPATDQSLIEDVVITDDVGEAPPSIAEDTAEPVAVEQVAVEPAPELISTEIVEDGIIYDFVAQQEVTVEEPRFDLDVVEFKGDLSDFIDADVARFSVDASDENCNSQGALWEFESITDMYPWETSWKLYREGEGSERELWVHGPPAKASYNRLTNYRGKVCLPAGYYEMEIFDSEGDGSCCTYGYGGYSIKVGGAVVAESNMKEDDPFEMRKHTFNIKPYETTTTTTTTATTTTTEESSTTTSATTTTATSEESEIEASTQDSTQDPTKSPSSEPSPKPTQAPSSSPSSKPTPVPTPEPTSVPTSKPTPGVESSDCRNPNMIVRIEILTDRKGAQTGYTFTDGSDNTIKERTAGTMSSETRYVDEACVSPGSYKLNMEDTYGNGIRSLGYVAVYVGDEKILHDYTFNEPTRSYTIRVGFNPVMTSTESEWLEGHNKRREEFHEANEKEFRPLVWSPEVAQGASDWAEKIVSDKCVLSRQSNLGFGELTFAMLTSNENAPITEPESILTRWYDNKVDRNVPSLVDDNGIPGLAFSQVVWYASRQLGCAKQVGRLSNGRYCHVAICRYATAGNCNVRMRSNQWKGPTLADKSICTPQCAENEGCH